MLYFAPGKTNLDYPDGRHSLPTIDDQVSAFHDTYKVWFLNIAEQVTKIPDSGFAVLAKLNPYFEMIARYETGTTSKQARGKSSDLVRYGITRVYPELKSKPILAEMVCHHLADALRNSVAHIGLTGTNVLLSNDYDAPMKVHYNDTQGTVELIMIGINPALWVERIQTHFEHFVEQLRDPNNDDLRTAFSAVFLEKIVRVSSVR